MDFVENVKFVRRQRPDGVDDLAFDLWLPEEQSKTTLIVYAHGGGFRHGGRKSVTTTEIAEMFTGLGFSFASVSYRLRGGWNDFERKHIRPVKREMRRVGREKLSLNKNLYGPAFVLATQDLSDAVLYLQNNSQSLGVVPGRIVLLGVSAGAIAAVAAAYPADGHHIPIDAVLGLGGAVVRPWRLRAEGPPVMLVHGKNDRIIRPDNLQSAQRWAARTRAPLDIRMLEGVWHLDIFEKFMTYQDPDGGRLFDEAVDFLAGRKGGLNVW